MEILSPWKKPLNSNFTIKYYPIDNFSALAHRKNTKIKESLPISLHILYTLKYHLFRYFDLCRLAAVPNSNYH